MNQFARTQLLLGEDSVAILSRSRVAVFGIGGVGGYVVEALCRCGIGELDLIDNDVVSITNLNRQIYALHSTVGRYKVDVARERILDINPDAVVHTHKTFVLAQNVRSFDFSAWDYVVDAIDTVSGKIALVEEAYRAHVPIISSMGAGNKLDPSSFEVADIYETSVCPLARVMRREMRSRGIPALKVVYSREKPCVPKGTSEEEQGSRRSLPGSISFVPSSAGLIIAKEVVKDLLSCRKDAP